MAGLSLVGAGMTALLLIPVTATATLTAVPLLIGAESIRLIGGGLMT
jgi:hypothetical protein